jgi:hypothetical protein
MTTVVKDAKVLKNKLNLLTIMQIFIFCLLIN